MRSMQASKWRSHAVGVATGLLAICGVGRADTICVPDDYGTIHTAIHAAAPGDEICVAPGTYREAIRFRGKAVRVYSTDGPELTVIEATPVIQCVDGEGPDTILEGFTITSTWRGMLNSGAGPTVKNCTFTGTPNGGMHNLEGSSPIVTNCTFTQSEQVGMYNSRSSPTVVDCSFTENAGGGMWNALGSSPTVTSCTFARNGGYWGGGMRNTGGSSPAVTNCTFRENTPLEGGGGMHNGSANPSVTNCAFIGNETVEGGGISNYRSNPVVTNCTFVDNVAASGRAISCGWGDRSTVTLRNCILWDGGDEVWNDDNDSTILVTYSDVQGGYEGVGNIDVDPVCDADGRPQAGSPCTDAGVNNAVPADVLDLDEDGDTAERIPIDIDGNHRFMDDGATEDTGCGPIVVDMGAYEFTGEPMHPVLIGDIDGDGIIGADDLVELIGAWGQCDPACCPADVDFTWAVDFIDLLFVLDNWT